MYFEEDQCFEEGYFRGCLGCRGHEKSLFCRVGKQWWGTSHCYLMNRSELEELLRCFVYENHIICGFCEECYTCERLKEIRKRLDNAYFLKNWTGGCLYHPYVWKVFFIFIQRFAQRKRRIVNNFRCFLCK